MKPFWRLSGIRFLNKGKEQGLKNLAAVLNQSKKAVSMKNLFMNNKNKPENLAWLAKNFPDHKPEEIKNLIQTCPVCKNRIFSSMDGSFNFCPDCLIHFKNQKQILRIWLASSERNENELQTRPKI